MSSKSTGRLSPWRALAVIALAAALPRPADANGRYPQTMSVHFQPGSSQRIMVGATYGLLLSEDDGATWRLTCEDNIGYGGDFDPTYDISAKGTLFGGTFNGLSISRDNGCNWSYATDPLAGYWIGDVRVGTDDAIWAVTTSGARPNDVFVSRDDGVTFVSTGLTHERAWWKSVRIAPSDAQRVYVTGYQVPDPAAGDAGPSSPVPLFYRSDNGGESWTEMAFSFENESQLFMLGVSPKDPELVFARVNGATKDTLLRSDNGGLSWTPVLSFDNEAADITAFQIRADGTHVIAGTVNHGVKLSDDAGLTWKDPEQSPRMACVGERPADGALFSCGANWNPDKMALGRSSDGGETWVKDMRMLDIDDQLSCPAGSGHATKCSPSWPAFACMYSIGNFCPADAGVKPPTPTPPPADCGCSMSFAAVLLVLPWRRRRRPGL